MQQGEPGVLPLVAVKMEGPRFRELGASQKLECPVERDPLTPGSSPGRSSLDC